MSTYWRDYHRKRFDRLKPGPVGYKENDRERDEGQAGFFDGLGAALPAIGTAAGGLIGLAGGPGGAAIGAGIGGALGSGLGGLSTSHAGNLREPYEQADDERQQRIAMMMRALEGIR